jgi:CMP/dCMP kinase
MSTAMTSSHHDLGALSHVVVAVDGPSGSGKSSVSRAVASILGLRYLDTGALYRAITWWLLEHGVDTSSRDLVAANSGQPVLAVGTDPGKPAITADGFDVSELIRGAEVTAAVSAVSAVPAVRERLVEIQRREIGTGGIVVEGRDIGTVVVPDADIKVYLTASEEVRAERRAAEFSALDTPASVDLVAASIHRRDDLDSTRPQSPLRQADDAIFIDATFLTLDQVVDQVCGLVREWAETR